MNMHVRHVTGARFESVRESARKLFEANEGDKQKTVDALIKLAEGRSRVRDVLIKMGAEAMAGSFIRQERAGIQRGVESDQVRFTGTRTVVVPPVMTFKQAEMQRAVARRNVVRGWLRFPLPIPGNKVLGKANVADLAAGAEAYRRQSGDMAHKAAWLDAIRPKLPKGKTVAEVLDDAALDALYNSVAA